MARPPPPPPLPPTGFSLRRSPSWRMAVGVDQDATFEPPFHATNTQVRPNRNVSRKTHQAGQKNRRGRSAGTQPKGHGGPAGDWPTKPQPCASKSPRHDRYGFRLPHPLRRRRRLSLLPAYVRLRGVTRQDKTSRDRASELASERATLAKRGARALRRHKK